MPAASPTRLVSIAGQIGWNRDSRQIPPGLPEQAEQALDNLLAILAAGGGRPEHLSRITCYLTDREEFVRHRAAIAGLLRRGIGTDPMPATTFVIVSGLVAPGSRIEIEATAALPDGGEVLPWQALRDALPDFDARVGEADRLAVAFILADDYSARRGTVCLCWPGIPVPEFRLHDGQIGTDWGLLLVLGREALTQIAARGSGRMPSLVRSGALKPFVLRPVEALAEAGLEEFVETLGLVFPKH